MTTSSVTPIAPVSAPFDCGICNVDHVCHCPRMKSWCNNCQPPEVQVSLPEADYQPVACLTMRGKVAATAYRRRLNLRAAV
jgi:hypothetical protein